MHNRGAKGLSSSLQTQLEIKTVAMICWKTRQVT